MRKSIRSKLVFLLVASAVFVSCAGGGKLMNVPRSPETIGICQSINGILVREFDKAYWDHHLLRADVFGNSVVVTSTLSSYPSPPVGLSKREKFIEDVMDALLENACEITAHWPAIDYLIVGHQVSYNLKAISGASIEDLCKGGSPVSLGMAEGHLAPRNGDLQRLVGYGLKEKKYEQVSGDMFGRKRGREDFLVEPE